MLSTPTVGKLPTRDSVGKLRARAVSAYSTTALGPVRHGSLNSDSRTSYGEKTPDHPVPTTEPHPTRTSPVPADRIQLKRGSKWR